MDSVLLLLTLLAIIKSVMTGSILPRWWQGALFGLLCGAFVWICHPYALEMNKLQVETALSEQSALMNISLIVSIDLLLTFGTCWAQIAPQRSTRWMRYIPSLLVLPALFYLQIMLFFNLPGTSFNAVSGILAAGAFIVLAGGGSAMRYLLPSAEQRIELTLLAAMLIFALTVCCTVFHPSATVVGQSSGVDWRSTALAFAVVAVLFVTGYFTPRILKKLKKQHN